MKKNSKENKKRLSLGNVVAIILCGVLAASALLAGVGFMSKGFTNTDVGSWFERDLNEKNLVKVEDYNDNLANELSNGLKINWKDDGTIVLSGKVDDKTKTDDQTPEVYTFTSVNLKGGKIYNVSCDNKFCSKSTYGLFVDYIDSNGLKVAQEVDSNGLVIDLTDSGDTVVKLSFFYENDVTYYGINSYIRPVLVEGESVGAYYN